MSGISGLVKKDWLLMGRQLKLMLLYILLFVGIFSAVMNDMTAMTSFFSAIFCLLSVNCFAYDEQVNFEKLAAASPVPVHARVLARYISALSVGIGGGAAVMLISGAVSMLRKAEPQVISAMPENLIGTVAAAAVIISILFPLLYRFGINKGRLIIMLAAALPFAVIIGIRSLAPQLLSETPVFPPALRQWLPLLIAVAVLAVLAGSLALSARILRRKEY